MMMLTIATAISPFKLPKAARAGAAAARRKQCGDRIS